MHASATIANVLLDPLQSSIGRHALAEVVLLGALSGALGFWVVSYGLSYGAESLATVSCRDWSARRSWARRCSPGRSQGSGSRPS